MFHDSRSARSRTCTRRVDDNTAMRADGSRIADQIGLTVVSHSPEDRALAAVGRTLQEN